MMRGRPKILLAMQYEEGLALFKKYRHNLLGVISDVSYFKGGKRDPEAGFEFLKYVKQLSNHILLVEPLTTLLYVVTCNASVHVFINDYFLAHNIVFETTIIKNRGQTLSY